MVRLFLTIFILFVNIFISFAQVNELCKKSTEGNDFWFGFMESRNFNPAHYLEITVTAREATTFQITIGPEEVPFSEGNYFVNANESRLIIIPWKFVESIGSEIIYEYGIHLVSEKPVNVYALNWDRNSADVAVIYPTESLGTEYFAMCYDVNVRESNNGDYGSGRNSEFLIVAAHDSTNVLIIPSKVTDQLVNAGDSILVTLNAGETYQVQSMNRKNLSGQGDLTGSYISASKPVAFYSGSLATTVPVVSGVSAWDHLYEQIPPIHSWGREFFAVPLKSREQDRYRIMAAEDNTIVHITGKQNIILNRGEFKEIVLYYNEPSRIFADKPILVAQYSQSQSVDENFTGKNGDPFMIILSSITQSKNDVTFVAYNSTQIKVYFVNIITLTSEINNIRFDGQPIAGEFIPFPEGNYSYTQKAINPGTHRIENINKDRGFLAYVYGFGGLESYGYGVGFNLDLVLDLGENIDFDGDTLLLCYGEKITLDAGPYFDTYNWNTGDSTQKITVDTAGKYSVQTTTIDGCNLEDSIFVFVPPQPFVDLGDELDKGCSPYSIELNGNDGFEKYLWQNEFNDTLSTKQFFIADKTGEYRLTVFDTYQCHARDTMKLVVFPVPNIKIEGNTLICGAKINELSVSITDAPDSVWNYNGSYTWTSNNPANIIFSEKSHTSAKITVTEWAKYEMFYQLKTIDGCLTNDTFQVDFHPVPTSDFEFVDNPDDKCKGYSREVLYNGNATENANYFWDYGGSKLIDSISWDNLKVSIGAFNTNPYIKLFVEENGCWSDTTSKPLGANPDFILDTEKERGCDSMTVLFKGTLNVPDSLLFEWDFGDGSPISHSQNIVHHYAHEGFYDVALTITNVLSGCQIGYEIDSMIKIFSTPIAKISADPSFCYSDSAQIFYTYNIDSSFCAWNFEGAHQVGNGNDSIWMMIDEPFGKAILTVNEFGCISQPDEITLKRKPHFNFYTDKEEGCQPSTLEVFAELQDDFLKMEWLSDSTTNLNQVSQIYNFPNQGKFDVSLAVNSMQTACKDTLIKTDWITVHPKPVSKFDVDFPVALIENATLSFTNLSENATEFLWDFGDSETSMDFEPIHTFSKLGDYNNQLFVMSEFGCKDTSEFIIKILPFAVFTPNAFRPASEIPENRTFMPVGIGADETRFNLKIYNRWGQMVFETDSPLHPWDGSDRNGNSAPVGNYVWISHFFDIQGYEHNQKGQILLIR